MKKQVKLLSSVMALALVSGVAMINQTASAETTAPTDVFMMATGASVRVPDVTNTDVTTNDNGLRFTAYMSQDNYSETATYGTFIMPVEYYVENPVNATALSENYYWKTGEDEEGNPVYNTTETDGKKQIINVEAIAYLDEVDYNEDETTEEMYVINGSVRHIKQANLALNYIGVSYAYENGEYTFATQTTDNARSVVSVAQKALLNAENDKAFVDNENGTTAEKITAVDNAYTARYVNAYKEANNDEYPTVEMNVRAYKDISSTSGYVAETTISKIEVPFTGYNATATGMAKTIDGYTYVSLKTEPVTVMFDGSSEEIKHYYDYTANDIVLWDGDTVLADTSFGVTQYWNKVDYSTDAADYRECAKVNNELVYSGKSMAILTTADSWDGPLWRTPVQVNASKFSFYVSVPEDGQVKLEVRGTKVDGTTTWVGGTQVFDLQAGVQKVDVDLGETVVALDGFNFKTRFNGKHVFLIDNICVEKEAYTEQSVGKLPDVFESEFTVNVPTEIKSTVYFGEDVMPTATLEYKEPTATAWTKATNATVTPATGVNTYNVRVTVGDAVLAEKTVRRGTMVMTFDEAPGAEITVGTTTFVDYAANRDYIAAADNGAYRKYDRQSGDTSFADVADIVSIDGYDGYFVRNGWHGGYLRRKMWGSTKYLNEGSTETYTKVGVWAYAAVATSYTSMLYHYNAFNASGTDLGNNYWQMVYEDGTVSDTYEFKAGYHYYEFVLKGAPEFSYMKTIWISGYSGNKQICFDQFAFLK